jgi:hypothetical protein
VSAENEGREGVQAAPATGGSGLGGIFVLEVLLLIPWYIFAFMAGMAVQSDSAWVRWAGQLFTWYPLALLVCAFAALALRREGMDAAAWVAVMPLACLVAFPVVLFIG